MIATGPAADQTGTVPIAQCSRLGCNATDHLRPLRLRVRIDPLDRNTPTVEHPETVVFWEPLYLCPRCLPDFDGVALRADVAPAGNPYIVRNPTPRSTP